MPREAKKNKVEQTLGFCVEQAFEQPVTNEPPHAQELQPCLASPLITTEPPVSSF